MILVDGKALAANLLAEVKASVSTLTAAPHLVVITCAPNFETQKYLALKKAKADGIIVQLPLPAHIDTAAVLAAVPASHDVDAFKYQTGETTVLPPVVGAIDEIAKQHQVQFENKQVVIFGAGRLVGAPAARYATLRGAKVTVLTEDSTDSVEAVLAADIIILGVGKPNLLTLDMVKEGVVVFDAGASEDGGLLVGDADPTVASKASLFTPVPGGIGPMTIALLFRNLLELKARQ